VYLVQDTFNRNVLVAIKVLAVGSGPDDAVSDALLRELNLSRTINHMNVLQGEEFFRDDDFAAFTMEFIEAGSLADRLERREPLRINSVIKILSQLCDGMCAIHDAGIVHRDIQPENILLTSKDVDKISDFGISAKSPSRGGDPRESITGSLNYLSPEYVSTGEYDVRSDIYAIGVIAYELTTGRLPFEGRTLLDTLLQRVRFDPSPPHLYSAHVPRPLSHAILRAMNRNPTRRFQSLEEVRDAFDFIKLPSGLPLWAMQSA
jgi:serine/threonine-protein kinase